MRKRLDRSDEDGFTLIELIVAMLIISILATIGAQAFYQQRRKGWVAHVHSALRHMAGAENHHIYGGGDGYTMSVEDLVATGFTYNENYVEPLVLAADAGTFCIQMTSTKDPSIVWHFNSEVGKPREGAGGPTECGVGAGSGTGTLVAGEFDDPNGTNGGNSRTDGGGGENEDGTDHDGSGVVFYPGHNPGGGSNPPPPGGGGIPPPDVDGDGIPDDEDDEFDPPVTDDDPTDDSTTTGGGGNGGDGGCRGDRNDPDAGNNGGRDEVGGAGGNDPDRDCNNGSGNDDDGEDDNNAGGK